MGNPFISAERAEIGARLIHLRVCSAAPRALAEFFAHGFAMQASEISPGVWRCGFAEREISVAAGRPNSTAFVAYAFDDARAFERHRAAVAGRAVVQGVNPWPGFDERAYSVRDPDGNVVVFGVRGAAPQVERDDLPARLQHVVFRTPELDAMVEFYERKLGFVVSDRVKDSDGVLRACFLRTDAEHHSLALFRAPEARLDHHSYETADWEHIRRWADRMAAKRIPIFWGVGRHGPGDDLFFMVKDPDDNLVEISAEIEQCAADRREGLWPHEQRTLNVWGNAIMRS